MAKSEPLVKRPTWDEYFMQMAELTAQRSTCLRRHVGAVIVQDKHVVATGYNGAPKGVAHCAEIGGCLREKMGIPSGERHELCRALHAEQNAIIQAATLAQSIEGASIYITQCGHQADRRQGRLPRRNVCQDAR